MRLIIAPAARADIASIWEFVALGSAVSADRLVDEFYSAFDRLLELPDIGHRHASAPGLNLRCWTLRGTWLVFYRRDDNVVEIVRVVSGRQDIRLLDQ